MTKTYVSIIHHFLKLAILLGFTLYIANLVITGNILFYIAPPLVKYVDLATAALLIFTIYQLYLFIRSFKKPSNPVCSSCNSHDQDHDHHDHDHHNHDHNHHHDNGHSHEPSRSLGKNIILYGLFIAPLVLGFLVPSEAFAGSLAKSKGVSLNGVAASSNGVPPDLAVLSGTDNENIKELFQTDTYNKDFSKLGMLLYQQDLIEMKDQWFIEKLETLNLFANNFTGKQIKISGFIYREDGLQPDQFIVGRMAMTHCIADIAPYGIIAETSDAQNYADDSWVTITGTIASTNYHEQTMIKILVQSIEPAEQPTIPYIYPDWNFAKKLK